MSPSDAAVINPQTDFDPSKLDAMKLGVRQALREHIARGVPIVTWDRETRQTIEIPADQIEAWARKTDPDF